MPKPNIVKAFVQADGSVFEDTGKGLKSLQVKGATSEELGSFVLSEDTPPGASLEISNVPYKQSLKLMIDFRGISGTVSPVRYVLRFNGDEDDNYRTPPNFSAASNKAIIAGVGLSVGPDISDKTRIFGTLAISNDYDAIKMGNGFITTNREWAYGGAVPLFAWVNEAAVIEKITIQAQTPSGASIDNHIFCAGSRIKVLGRDF